MNTEREAELLDRIAKLELQLERADKVKRTLMERVERSIDASDGAFAVFERNIILQQAVEARTAELAELNRRLLVEISAREEIERHLERSRDEALAAGRAKSEFVANMSHEVRTPMNGILGMVELMLRTALSTRQREYARTIQRSAEALLAVLDDILDFSKIEAGKMSIDPQPFDLGLAIEDVAELFMPRIEEKGLQLVVKCDPTLPPRVVGDPARIRQVITNLVGNAVKFTERGKVTLSLVCIDHTARGARVMVSVSDTGIGIPRDRLDAIFERFTQADSSTTRRYGGAGLGLTISRRLVELMGGEIGVESDIGRGSTFWFKLLLPVPEAQASGASDAAEPVIPQSLGRPLRVLVVEDNDVNRVVAMQLLAELGCLCDVATNGEAAIQLTERTSYDVVFMDCQMPGLDGFEATARIRQREAEAGGHLPIVALTANAMAGARERCTAAGMDDYLAKPVTLTTLGRALARHAPGGATQPQTLTLDVAPPAAPEVPASDAPVLDLDRALDIAMYRPDLLRYVFEVFRRDAPARIERLHGAMLDAELRVVEREAHSLKGAATNLGAERLTRAARDVEDEAARGHLPGDDAIAALVREVAALLDAIEKVDFERLPRRDEARALR